MNADIPVDGLPLPDRIKIRVANWLLGRVSLPGRIRLRWHILHERSTP